ncbi:MAG: hypothetical protein H8E21_13615 [Gammaproteobacteria bacterium]|nr:hypothetical protein [Gammaproteobacteria bacterium]
MIDEPYEPVSAVDHEAPGQYLVRTVIEANGGSVEFIPVPWKRCIAGNRTGEYDGILGIVDDPELFSFISYPRSQGVVNSQERLAPLEFVIMRRKGIDASWDGQRFEHLTGPVLYGRGIVAIRLKLAALNTPGSEEAKTLAQVARMVFAGRYELGALRRNEAQALVQLPEFGGQLEILPTTFEEVSVYFGVARHLYQTNALFFDAVWESIARQRSHSDWPEQARRLLAVP